MTGFADIIPFSSLVTITFVNAILGHMVGDYILQDQWMATEKSQPGWRGHYACTIHVLLYTLAIALFTNLLSIPFLLWVALPHWVIDRYSLAKYWLKLKNGYGMEDVWEKAPLCAMPPPGQMERNVWKTAFAAPVYILNDNTMHFVCLWLTIKFYYWLYLFSYINGQ